MAFKQIIVYFKHSSVFLKLFDFCMKAEWEEEAG